MENNKSKVYIKIDEQSRILRCEGGYTMSNISDISEWLFIDEGNGDKYNLCQSNYFDGGLYTEDGICRYRWTGKEAVLRTEEEIAGEHNVSPAPVPTQRQLYAAHKENGDHRGCIACGEEVPRCYLGD